MSALNYFAAGCCATACVGQLTRGDHLGALISFCFCALNLLVA